MIKKIQTDFAVRDAIFDLCCAKIAFCFATGIPIDEDVSVIVDKCICDLEDEFVVEIHLHKENYEQLERDLQEEIEEWKDAQTDE